MTQTEYQCIVNRHAERCDGTEYEMIIRAIEKIKDLQGLVLEIGTRKGGSMMIIIDALLENEDYNRNVISVDPYGDIEYNSGYQYGVTRFDYTNEMKKEAMASIFQYIQGNPINFVPFCLTSERFFEVFGNKVPVYCDMICIDWLPYAFAFIDGQHDTESVINDCAKVASNSVSGTRIVIDNIDFFDLDQLIDVMTFHQFEIEEKGITKITFVCKR